MEGIEELQVSIETKLYEINYDKLRDVAEYMLIENTDGKSKLFIIRKIREELEENIAASESEGQGDLLAVSRYLKQILAYISGELSIMETTRDENGGEMAAKALAEAKEDYEKLQNEFLVMMSLQEKKIIEAKERIQKLCSQVPQDPTPHTQSNVLHHPAHSPTLSNNPSPNPRIPLSRPPVLSLPAHPINPNPPFVPGQMPSQPFHHAVQTPQPGESVFADDRNLSVRNMLRFKDFKVQGTISNEKSRISYTNLNKQIESAIAKGYSEAEIVDAVINAVSPSLHLRSYLEGIKSLSLSDLRQILRSHYCEKSATEAYQELTNVVQESSETPQNFLMRALKLRQHVLLASQEKDSKIRYDENLIRSVFINAVETGLADDAIRSRMRPFLQSPNVSDETLIREINTAMTAENERLSKLSARKRVTKPNQLAVAATEVSTGKPATQETKKGKQDVLIASLQEVRADVASLKQAMTTTRAENESRSKRPTRPPSACDACVSNDTRDKCTHCFVCGSDEHFARGCKKRKQRGNRGQLHPRDAV